MQSVPSKLQFVPNHYLFSDQNNMINRHEGHVGDAAIFPPSQRFRHEFMSRQAAYGAKEKIKEFGSPQSTPKLRESKYARKNV